MGSTDTRGYEQKSVNQIDENFICHRHLYMYPRRTFWFSAVVRLPSWGWRLTTTYSIKNLHLGTLRKK